MPYTGGTGVCAHTHRSPRLTIVSRRRAHAANLTAGSNQPGGDFASIPKIWLASETDRYLYCNTSEHI